MYSKVKRLRRGGERISDRDIAADPGIVGHMTVCQVEHTIVAKVHAAGDDSRMSPVIPELFAPALSACAATRCCSRALSALVTS